MNKRSFGLFSLMLVGLFIFAACADPAQPTATPNSSINPTPATGGPATPTPGSGETPVTGPTATTAAPDPVAGQAAFATNCTGCHTTTDQTLVGPGLAGVGARAETRVPGLSADAYLAESIKDPGAFLVPGFGALMPSFASLGDDQINNLIAYLKTLE